MVLRVEEIFLLQPLLEGGGVFRLNERLWKPLGVRVPASEPQGSIASLCAFNDLYKALKEPKMVLIPNPCCPLDQR